MTTTARFLVRIAAMSVLAAWPQLAAAAATPPVPELSIALRGLVDDTLEQGEGLRVTVRLESSGEGSGSLEIAPASGTWADAIAVELLAASGGAVLARGTAVGAPGSPRATIDRERIAGGMWVIAASATQGLAPGDYLVRARLEVKAGAGWTGAVASDDAPLTIIAVSAAPERVSARTIARAQALVSERAFEAAAKLVDAVLAQTPDDFELLCLRADVALAGGNPAAAMICLGRAARQRSPKASGPPPPVFHDVQSRVLAAQLGNAPDATVPAWTWPPASVLKPLENALPQP